MKFKKVMVLAMAGVMTIGTLAGCSGGSGSTESSGDAEASTEAAAEESTEAAADAETQDDEEVTIKVALWDYSSTEYYHTMFDAFTEKYPNIKYEVVEFSADEYPTAIQTQLAARTDFDVVFLKDLPTMSQLISQGHLTPIDDYIANDDSFDTANYSGLIEQLAVDGSTYGVPFRKDNNMIFYNKDLFDAAGVDYPTDGMTMEEYEALAEKMTSGTGNDKVYGAHMHTWASNAFMYERRTENFNPVDTSTYDNLIDTYKVLFDMQDKGYIQDYGSLKASNIHYSGVFYNQQAAMLQMGTWFINMLCENVTFNWGVCSLPSADGEGNDKAAGGVTPVCIGGYSEHPDAAWKFITYVCGEEGAKVIADCGVLPGYGSDAINDIFDGLAEKYEGVPEGLSKYIDLDTYVIEFPMDTRAKDIDTILTEEHSAIMTNTETPEEGVQNMIDRVNALQ